MAACLALCRPVAHAADMEPGGGHVEKLLLTGSSTMAPLMKEIAARFLTQHPGVQVEVQGGGSGRGIDDALAGRADIGMCSRALTGREKNLFGFPIARDGVCLILHRDNPIAALTNRQIVDIHTGKLTNWRLAGGRDAPIAVLNPASTYSSTELFTTFFNIKYSDIKAQQLVGDNPTRITAVAANPNAISYVSVGEAQRRVLGGAPIKLMPVDGVAATSGNIRTGNFPISRPLTLVTRGLPTGLVKQFIEFSLSSQVSDLIIAHDFVSYMD
jgi:phosphate transport system substrate-binding protein